MTDKRTAFFISDGTGITSEALGLSLLKRFDTIRFEKETLPYVDSVEKAKEVVERINQRAELDGARPIVFDTLVDDTLRSIVSSSNALQIDVFAAFLGPLTEELGIQPGDTIGRARIGESSDYEYRMEAINYALHNDDGARTKQYDEADVILVGVSRSGKTPTCLYLAMQYGIQAANYPITEEDIEDQKLPALLKSYRGKIFGLTIEPERLSLIRNERKPNSRYATMKQCNYEVEEVELMYRRERIPFMNTTDYSVEEIATRIMVQSGLQRRC
ncbi:phosphoenolpyruvate synthase regulatory protein [Oleiphilus sp. HI0071]|jgi:regulator of PEP synthase PpsR (kinase-PPPase family)|nr:MULTISPECIES: pyruvate, water dikinase regulatory protein [unclassified Oleiphilus]KZY84647.1 phosphoenolpyruvate synthase regulatory protein [Oleiphilus sp. HI0071]KZY91828.1 phosphoenolpyruvate synthase regulatory protein [Oleiphilus sp. HI0073]KZZ48689.1 phosphoenolpyruvate synthase regulatory protein [Oleiphilus sp. HI0122]KZZ49779.1 phosphoenolpyruvate synthase regulatory protein [Oleiphilus sp. HI0118]KZZ63568.1 phosphoenolpyruvate synthase regulatory protein [Oleiphilus sp. HI0130]K